jgi:hypothetical protein
MERKDAKTRRKDRKRLTKALERTPSYCPSQGTYRSPRTRSLIRDKTFMRLFEEFQRNTLATDLQNRDAEESVADPSNVP